MGVIGAHGGVEGREGEGWRRSRGLVGEPGARVVSVSRRRDSRKDCVPDPTEVLALLKEVDRPIPARVLGNVGERLEHRDAGRAAADDGDRLGVGDDDGWHRLQWEVWSRT